MQRLSLPDQLVEQARAYAEGSATPVEPRNAATVVLMRPGQQGAGDDGVEVYLLRRQTSMAFAGGMCVFPGGGVDPRDYDHAVAWAGPSPAEWATRLGVEEPMARALVCAAVRETFEESGVLLAGTVDSVVADTTGDDWEADRVALEGRELSLTDFLDRRGLVLRTDLLGAFAGWLTPVFEPRRYRTWFFAASLPQGQVTRDVSTESSSVAWLPAMEAVAQAEAGDILMLPPTYLSCLEVGQYAGPAAVLAETAGRSVDMFTPEVVPAGGPASGGADDDEFVLSMPPQYESLVALR